MIKNFLIFILAVISVVVFSSNNSLAAITWISTSPLPSAYVGVPYSFQLTATGETLPVTYSIVPITGSLPVGLSLSPSGLISGTVTSPGSNAFTVNATANTIAGLPESLAKSFTISSLATGVTGSLRIKRLQLRFSNNRPEITVEKNQPSPRLFADLSFIGSGILRGYWRVDGTIHAQFQQNLMSGSETTLSMPPTPPLPTYQTGGHRVALVITEPVIGSVPEAIYYVIEKERKAFAPIGILYPTDRAEVDFTPLRFSWHLQQGSKAYLVEFLETEESEPVFSAYTRSPGYALPEHSLRRFFSGNTTYLWRVQAFSEEGGKINESDLHHLTFR